MYDWIPANIIFCIPPNQHVMNQYYLTIRCGGITLNTKAAYLSWVCLLWNMLQFDPVFYTKLHNFYLEYHSWNSQKEKVLGSAIEIAKCKGSIKFKEKKWRLLENVHPLCCKTHLSLVPYEPFWDLGKMAVFFALLWMTVVRQSSVVFPIIVFELLCEK